MNIIIKPIITEKMTKQGEELNRYGFVVNHKANKIEIKKAVSKKYGVNVERVNTMLYQGKNKSRYTKTGMVEGRTNKYKKAIVTVADGDTIDFFSNI